MQYGFIVGRDIHYNILNVQMIMDFVTQILCHMGFGARMSSLTFMLGLSALSHVILNGRFNKTIPLTRSGDKEAH